jgi:hypothetical protein
MNDIEDRLHAHLAARAKEVTPSDMLAEIMSDTTVVALSPSNRGHRWWVAAAVAAAVVLIVVAAFAVIRRGNPNTSPSDQPPAPLPPGVPPTGVEWTPVGQVKLGAATRILQQECMQRAGFDYDSGAEAMALSIGAWEPHAVLGIGTEEAAARYGYRMADPPEFGPDKAAAALNESDRERFYAALTGGPETPTVDITLPDGTSSGIEQSWGGCMAQLDDTFDGLLSQQEGLRSYVQEGATDQEALVEQTTNDDRVASALALWRSCVARHAGEAAIGEAQTPNELARTYALSGVEVTTAETDLAVTDAHCQTETDLQTTWYRVYAEYQRAALTEHPEWFDLLAGMRTQIVAQAAEILREHGLDSIGS